MKEVNANILHDWILMDVDVNMIVNIVMQNHYLISESYGIRMIQV